MKNKFLIDNSEKIFLYGLIIILISLILVYISGFHLNQIDIKSELLSIRFFKPPEGVEGLDKYKNAIRDLQKKEKFVIYEDYFRKDGFTKYVRAIPLKPLFKLRSIEKLPLDIKYKGFIEYTGGIIGQINLKGTTHFVKEGEKLIEYKILQLHREYTIVKDDKGNKIRLPLREEVLSSEYEAAIYLTYEDKTSKVKKGDRIKSLLILDILPDYVVLFNEITNKKEILKKDE